MKENGSKQMKLFTIQLKGSNLVKILLKTSINPLGYIQCGNYFLTLITYRTWYSFVTLFQSRFSIKKIPQNTKVYVHKMAQRLSFKIILKIQYIESLLECFGWLK